MVLELWIVEVGLFVLVDGLCVVDVVVLCEADVVDDLPVVAVDPELDEDCPLEIDEEVADETAGADPELGEVQFPYKGWL